MLPDRLESLATTLGRLTAACSGNTGLLTVLVVAGTSVAVAVATRRRQILRSAAGFAPPVPAGVRDGWTFFRAWLRNPLQVAAVLPSGPALAAAITAEITPASAPVIELGPGTGVFTRALIGRGVPERHIALIERHADFGARLAQRFPEAQLHRMDAAALHKAVLFDGIAAGAVVSGLPLLSMPPRQVIAVLSGAFRQLRADGCFYQFTYGPRCPVPRGILERLGLEAERVGSAFANMPPAAVYRIRRRAPA